MLYLVVHTCKASAGEAELAGQPAGWAPRSEKDLRPRKKVGNAWGCHLAFTQTCNYVCPHTQTQRYINTLMYEHTPIHTLTMQPRMSLNWWQSSCLASQVLGLLERCKMPDCMPHLGMVLYPVSIWFIIILLYTQRESLETSTWTVVKDASLVFNSTADLVVFFETHPRDRRSDLRSTLISMLLIFKGFLSFELNRSACSQLHCKLTPLIFNKN